MALRVGIISDTHGHIDAAALQHLESCDEIWHAGDIDSLSVLHALESLGSTVRAVHGNVDGSEIRSIVPPFQQFAIGKLHIFITHIAGYGEQLPIDLIDHYHSRPFHVLVCGHTHIAKVRRLQNVDVLYLNPGAAGKFGPHTVRTLLLGTIDNGRFTEMNLVELGPK